MTNRSGEDRKRSLAFLAGLDAERLALLVMVMKGYWPLARRYLTHAGEIDLIMQRGKTIVAVEVKARATLEAAERTFTHAKLKRIGAALAAFRAERRLDDRYVFRCDAVFIAPRRWPRHVVNAGPLE
ncbi:MAG: YraN family protein [Methylocystis sp.]|nr:YraN family protein [Methylocystis sp.]MCA3584910.1 YraN family protein [Methylocystis sp.]MCA3589695.1 YraN family protein [Methylocystis sp.]MCA3591128.1 YraN family protein [Methylocystis sp.]